MRVGAGRCAPGCPALRPGGLARRRERGFRYTGCIPEGVVGLIGVVAPLACSWSQRSAFSAKARMVRVACARGEAKMASASA